MVTVYVYLDDRVESVLLVSMRWTDGLDHLYEVIMWHTAASINSGNIQLAAMSVSLQND